MKPDSKLFRTPAFWMAAAMALLGWSLVGLVATMHALDAAASSGSPQLVLQILRSEQDSWTLWLIASATLLAVVALWTAYERRQSRARLGAEPDELAQRVRLLAQGELAAAATPGVPTGAMQQLEELRLRMIRIVLLVRSNELAAHEFEALARRTMEAANQPDAASRRP